MIKSIFKSDFSLRLVSGKTVWLSSEREIPAESQITQFPLFSFWWCHNFTCTLCFCFPLCWVFPIYFDFISRLCQLDIENDWLQFYINSAFTCVDFWICCQSIPKTRGWFGSNDNIWDMFFFVCIAFVHISTLHLCLYQLRWDLWETCTHNSDSRHFRLC